jgi:hypothetical protein
MLAAGSHSRAHSGHSPQRPSHTVTGIPLRRPAAPCWRTSSLPGGGRSPRMSPSHSAKETYESIATAWSNSMPALVADASTTSVMTGASPWRSRFPSNRKRGWVPLARGRGKRRSPSLRESWATSRRFSGMSVRGRRDRARSRARSLIAHSISDEGPAPRRVPRSRWIVTRSVSNSQNCAYEGGSFPRPRWVRRSLDSVRGSLVRWRPGKRRASSWMQRSIKGILSSRPPPTRRPCRARRSDHRPRMESLSTISCARVERARGTGSSARSKSRLRRGPTASPRTAQISRFFIADSRAALRSFDSSGESPVVIRAW